MLLKALLASIKACTLLILKWLNWAAIFDQSGEALNPSVPPVVLSQAMCLYTNFQLKQLKGTCSLQLTELLREHIQSQDIVGGSNSIFVHGHQIFAKCTCTKCTKMYKNVQNMFFPVWNFPG